MGMDVYGNSGNYFRRSVWGWHPLAEFCRWLAPEITAPCRYWHSNDGDGLDAAHAKQLSDAIVDAVADGRAAAYIASRDAKLAALPRVTCSQCGGSGVRSDDIGRTHGMITRIIREDGHPRHGQTGWCNGCDGIGTTASYDTYYPLTLDDVAEFASFLAESGGFCIR